MANLVGFLKPTYLERTAEAEISDRFVDEEGKPLKFIMKSMPQAKLQSILKNAVKEAQSKNGKRKGGNEIDEATQNRITAVCIVESCVQPDFKQTDICEAYGTVDPYLVPERMLNAGEYKKLSDMFLSLNELNDETIADLMAVTKN